MRCLQAAQCAALELAPALLGNVEGAAQVLQGRRGLLLQQAALEEQSGYRFRPPAPGTVAVLDSAGRALLELPLKGLGALPQAKLGQYLGDIEGLLSGELSPGALAKLAGTYDEADVRGRGGELPDETLIAGDHRAAEAVRNAYAAAQAHPGRRAEIARDLLQVLIERDSDLDLEELALETALEFLPGKGLYDLGVDAVQMARAIDEGDWSALATLGGVAPLDAIGTVPGIGPLAERGLRRLARGVGILKTAAREAAERIATPARAGGREASALEGAAEKELKKAEGEAGELDERSINADETELLAGKDGTSQGPLRSPSHAEAAQLAKDAEDYLVKLYGRGSASFDAGRNHPAWPRRRRSEHRRGLARRVRCRAQRHVARGSGTHCVLLGRAWGG